MTSGKVIAFAPSGTVKWSVVLPAICSATSNATSLRVGSDGNLYALIAPPAAKACAGSLRLVRFAASNGAIALTKSVGDNSSGASLYAYKTGLAVVQNRTVKFVGYDGADSGQFTAPATAFSVSVSVNASGTAFFAIGHGATTADGCSGGGYVIDSLNPIGVFGAQTATKLHECVQSVSILPLSNGGALLNESVATGSQLVEIGSSGAVKWRKSLPQQSGQKSYLAYPAIASDASGNIVVVRSTQTDSRYGVDVAVLSADTGTQQTVFSTDSLDATASFAWLSSPDGSSIGLAANRLYLTLRKCVGTSCSAALYAIGLSGLAMDYPRGAVIGGSQDLPSNRRLTAWLGDSYSSGEGAGNYFPGTNVPAVGKNYNMCHRSKNAYSQLLVGDPDLKLANAGFFACSGATTANIVDTYQYGTQPPQTMLLTKKVDLVVLTIGGNDVGFGDFATACADPRTTCGGLPYEQIVNRINNDLPDRLAKALDEISSHVAAGGEIILVGYPFIVQQPKSPYQGCGLLNGVEMVLARRVISRLNSVESTIVTAANDRNLQKGVRITFLDVNGKNSVFSGHELCTKKSAFNSLKAGGPVDNIPVESYHPNAYGQKLYAESIKSYLTVGK